MTQPTPPSPLDKMMWLTLVADASTPTEALPFAGRVIGVPSSMFNDISSDSTRPRRLYGVWGYRRAGANGNEFVMVSPLDTATTELVRARAAAGKEAQLRRVALILLHNYSIPPTIVREIIELTIDSSLL